jgi:hypothetical protein
MACALGARADIDDECFDSVVATNLRGVTP